MISIDALAVEFSGSTLFSDVSFVINENDKIEFGYDNSPNYIKAGPNR